MNVNTELDILHVVGRKPGGGGGLRLQEFTHIRKHFALIKQHQQSGGFGEDVSGAVGHATVFTYN
jgi:hypothetical protein